MRIILNDSADGCGDFVEKVLILDGTGLQGFAEAFGEFAGAFFVRLRENNDKFIPAEANNQVGTAEGFQEDSGHMFEETIAKAVTMLIVHGFKAIQIEHDQTEGGFFALAEEPEAFEFGLEIAAVEEAGQGIFHTLPLDFRDGLKEGGEVVGSVVDEGKVAGFQVDVVRRDECKNSKEGAPTHEGEIHGGIDVQRLFALRIDIEMEAFVFLAGPRIPCDGGQSFLAGVVESLMCGGSDVCFVKRFEATEIAFIDEYGSGIDRHPLFHEFEKAMNKSGGSGRFPDFGGEVA